MRAPDTIIHTSATSVRATPVINCLKDGVTYGDYRDDLARDGYAVIKGVLTPERAKYYVGEVHQWLEDFGLGYKRDDPSTNRPECLPVIDKKGLVMAYGAPHESFTWGIRTEPAVIDVFEKLYGTEDLIVAFDAVNVSLAGQKDKKENTAWPHQDQDPERPGFRCVQGFVNLLPCGDDDGGLMVLKGGHKCFEEYHQAFQNEERLFRWTNEMYVFKDSGLQWLQERGYEWVKVNCEPGDMVLWDSRSPHYNRSPLKDTSRIVVYTCMMPVETATQEELIRKRELFESCQGHSHWPQALQAHVREYVGPKRNGVPDPVNTWMPRKPPALSERGFKLTGIPYIKATM